MVSNVQLQLVKSADAGPQAWIAAATARFDAPASASIRRAFDDLLAVAERHDGLLERVCALADTVLQLDLDHEAVTATLLVPLLRLHLIDGADLRARHGDVIAELVEGVLRMGEIGALSSHALTPLRPEGQAATQLEALRKMLLAMVQDVRVVLVKLADHLQDLREAIKSGDDRKMAEMADITQDLFAPLANRLGVWQIKWELEDLALRVRDPESYKRIARLLDEKRQSRERYIENVVAILKGELARAGIAAEIYGRPKHIASIHRKMEKKRLDFEGLYDVRAVRVLVRDVKEDRKSVV